MISLQQRSRQKEMLDEPGIPFAAIRQNLKELNVINRYLGGHRITITGMHKLFEGMHRGPISICEIGCGGGDNLQALAKHCRKHAIQATFTGIDIKPSCIDFAKQQYPRLDARWIMSDYAAVDLQHDKPDIIFASLFCHHFTETELTQMLGWMYRNSARGFFINDLHRHPVAYFFIRLLTALFSKSVLVKNDAPLSVARGFTRKEWKSIFRSAGIKPQSIQWKWAFRHLIIAKHAT